MLDKMSEKIAENVKAELAEAMYSTAKLTLEAVDEASYIIALFGGAITILMRVAGSERAKRYFWGIQIAHIFVSGIVSELL